MPASSSRGRISTDSATDLEVELYFDDVRFSEDETAHELRMRSEQTVVAALSVADPTQTASRTTDEVGDGSKKQDTIHLLLRCAKPAFKKKVKLGTCNTFERLRTQFCKTYKLDPRPDKTVFAFDGEALTACDTPQSLDMEDDDIIDVVVRG